VEWDESYRGGFEDRKEVGGGKVSLTNLQVLNAILYVAEHGCKWWGLPSRFGRTCNV